MSFNSLLIDHMKIVSITVDEWLEPTESVSAAIKCRIMYGNIWVKDFKGEDTLSIAKIFCKPANITFDHEDFIQLDDEGYAKNHTILKIVKPQNSVHIHHGEIWIS